MIYCQLRRHYPPHFTITQLSRRGNQTITKKPQNFYCCDCRGIAVPSGAYDGRIYEKFPRGAGNFPVNFGFYVLFFLISTCVTSACDFTNPLWKNARGVCIIYDKIYYPRLTRAHTPDASEEFRVIPFPPCGENSIMLSPSSFFLTNPLRWALLGVREKGLSFSS